MRSVRELAQQEGMGALPLSLRLLGNHLQANSVRQMMATHDARVKYDQMGGVRSPLNLPIDDNFNGLAAAVTKPNGRGGFLSPFRGGQITVEDVNGGPIYTDLNRTVTVTFVGLECQIRQESEDEMYGTVGLIVPSSNLNKPVHFPDGQDFWTMGKNGERIVEANMLVYQGPPADIVLSCILVEHDSGDISKYKQEVAQALSQAAEAGLGALGVPAEAKSASTGWVNDLTLGLTNIVFSWLGADDDPYTPQALRLAYTDLRLADAIRFDGPQGVPTPFPEQTLTRDDDPRVLHYNVPPMIVNGTDQGGDTGQYAFYFRVDFSRDTSTH